jgi:transcriptional regulator with XRE-family HTH domain
MPRKNFKELRADLADRVGEERVAGAEQAELELYELEQLALGDIRKARSLTQTQLAKALGVTQAQVSRIEHQTDLFLSTLASYVEAMGGELNLIATFPDQTSVSISIGDLTNDAEGADFVGLIKMASGASPPPDLVTAVARDLGLPEEQIRQVKARVDARVSEIVDARVSEIVADKTTKVPVAGERESS